MNTVERYGIRTVALAMVSATVTTIAGPIAWAWIFPNHDAKNVLCGSLFAGLAVWALVMFTRFAAFDFRRKTDG